MSLRAIFFAILSTFCLSITWPLTVSLVNGFLLATYLDTEDQKMVEQLSQDERKESVMNRWHAVDLVEPYMQPQLWSTEWQNQLGVFRMMPFETAMSYGAPEHLSAFTGVPSQWVYLPDDGGLESPWNIAFDDLMQHYYTNPRGYLFSIMSKEDTPFLETVWHVRRPAMIYFGVATISNEDFQHNDIEFLPHRPVNVRVVELPVTVSGLERPVSRYDQLSLLTNNSIDLMLFPTWHFMRQSFDAFADHHQSQQKKYRVLRCMSQITHWLDQWAPLLNDRRLNEYLMTHTTNAPLSAIAFYNHHVQPQLRSFFGNANDG